MATVPLPDTPCVRARCIWNEGTPGEGSIRFYIGYSGSAPSGANCVTLAGDIADAWNSHLVPLMPDYFTLNEVDVLDIATDSGASGQVEVTHAGDRGGTVIPDQCALNIEYGIARRYRGGKPRSFLPPGVAEDTETASTWTSSYLSEAASGIEEFFSAFLGDTVGSMGTLTHLNLSYYKGKATSSPPWRGPGFKYPPAYRATALSDPITGYFPKTVIGSQKRRRTSTTP